MMSVKLSKEMNVELAIKGFNDIQVADQIETYEIVTVKRL